jgi:hypothetical protein
MGLLQKEGRNFNVACRQTTAELVSGLNHDIRIPVSNYGHQR